PAQPARPSVSLSHTCLRAQAEPWTVVACPLPAELGRRSGVGVLDRWSARAPVCGVLPGVAEAEDGRLVERAADDLQAERAAVGREAGGHGEHRQPEAVEPSRQAG